MRHVTHFCDKIKVGTYRKRGIKMNNKKVVVPVIVLVALAVLAGVYVGMHKDTAKDLQSNEWTIHDDSSIGGTAKFTKSGRMNLSIGNLDVDSFKYNVYKKNGHEYLKLQGKTAVGGQATKYVYEVKKDSDSYTMDLKKENELAKLETGSLQGDLQLDKK